MTYVEKKVKHWIVVRTTVGGGVITDLDRNEGFGYRIGYAYTLPW